MAQPRFIPLVLTADEKPAVASFERLERRAVEMKRKLVSDAGPSRVDLLSMQMIQRNMGGFTNADLRAAERAAEAMRRNWQSAQEQMWRDTERSDRQRAQSARSVADVQVREARRAADATTRTQQEVARASERAAREQVMAVQRVAREQIQSGERTRREELRVTERMHREQERTRREGLRSYERIERDKIRASERTAREQVRANRRAVDDQIADQRRLLGSVGSFAGSVVSTALGFAGGSILTSVLGSVTGQMRDGVRAGFDYNRMLQQATLGFTTLLGSVDAAHEHIADLTRFAETSPLDLPQALTASQRLQAMGFEAREVIPVLRAVTDAVAAQGRVGGEAAEQTNRVTLALSQMRQKGRVVFEEMRQLVEAGIPGWRYLAEYAARTNAEFARLPEAQRIPAIQRLAQQGRLDADAAVRAMVQGMRQQFGGMGERTARETVGGLETQIAEIFNRSAGRATENAFQRYQQGLQQMLQMMRGGAAENIAGGINDLSGQVLSSMENVIRATATGNMEQLGLDAIGGYARGIQRGVESVTSAGRGMVQQLFGAVEDEQQSRSPSLLFATLGERAAEGYLLGFQRGMQRVRQQPTIEQFAELIRQNALRTGVPEALIRAVMVGESSGDPTAVSHRGARGLMQLMPATAARFGVRNIHDPAENIRGGTDYLRWLLNRFGGNIPLALAGYNAGEGAVERYGNRIPPFRETQAYVPRVMRLYEQLSGLSGGSALPVNITGITVSAAQTITRTVENPLPRLREPGALEVARDAQGALRRARDLLSAEDQRIIQLQRREQELTRAFEIMANARPDPTARHVFGLQLSEALTRRINDAFRMQWQGAMRTARTPEELAERVRREEAARTAAERELAATRAELRELWTQRGWQPTRTITETRGPIYTAPNVTGAQMELEQRGREANFQSRIAEEQRFITWAVQNFGQSVANMTAAQVAEIRRQYEQLTTATVNAAESMARARALPEARAQFDLLSPSVGFQLPHSGASALIEFYSMQRPPLMPGMQQAADAAHEIEDVFGGLPPLIRETEEEAERAARQWEDTARSISGIFGDWFGNMVTRPREAFSQLRRDWIALLVGMGRDFIASKVYQLLNPQQGALGLGRGMGGGQQQGGGGIVGFIRGLFGGGGSGGAGSVLTGGFGGGNPAAAILGGGGSLLPLVTGMGAPPLMAGLKSITEQMGAQKAITQAVAAALPEPSRNWGLIMPGIGGGAGGANLGRFSGLATMLPMLGMGLGGMLGGQSMLGQLMGSGGGLLAGGALMTAILGKTVVAGMLGGGAFGGAIAGLLSNPITAIAGGALLVGAFLLARNKRRQEEEKVRNEASRTTGERLWQILRDVQRDRMDGVAAIAEVATLHQQWMQVASTLKDSKTRRHHIATWDHFQPIIANIHRATEDQLKRQETAKTLTYAFADGGAVWRGGSDGAAMRPFNGRIPGMYDRRDDRLIRVSGNEVVLNPAQWLPITDYLRAARVPGFDSPSYTPPRPKVAYADGGATFSAPSFSAPAPRQAEGQPIPLEIRIPVQLDGEDLKEVVVEVLISPDGRKATARNVRTARINGEL